MMFFGRNRAKFSKNSVNFADFRTFCALLKRFSYKPGSEFKAINNGSITKLIVYVPVINTKNNEPDQLQLSFLYDKEWLRRQSENDLINHIRTSVLHPGEIHESDEWFRYDGKLVHDPHAFL